VRVFLVLVRRDVRLALRQASDTLLVLVFFVLATVLFPLGVGPEPNMLARIAAGVVWVMALLAAMLSLDRLYQADYDDGSLDLLLLAPLPLEATALAKAFAHWLTTGLPLIAMAPVLAVMLRLETAGYPALVVAMALGTPAISLIGGVGAALAVGARRGGVLLSLLVLPLLVPVLIFGAGAVEAAVTGGAVASHLLLLGGTLLAALVLCPWASAAALRQAMD
jgi:heme exporter protein B